MRHPARLLGIGCNLFSAIGLRLADLRHPTGLQPSCAKMGTSSPAAAMKPSTSVVYMFNRTMLVGSIPVAASASFKFD